MANPWGYLDSKEKIGNSIIQYMKEQGFSRGEMAKELKRSGIRMGLDFSDEFHKMGTFADDYYRNVITPYKEGLRGKPGFWQSMRNWQPWRAVMPKNWGGTYYTKPTPMASNFLRGAAKIGSRALGPFSLLMSSPLNAGEDEAMARINEQWSQRSQQQNQGGGGGPPGQPSTGPHRGYGASVAPPPQRDYTAHVKAGAYGLRRGGIASLWHR